MILPLLLPARSATSTVGALAAFSDTPAPNARKPPALGEHTEEIMAELDFSAGEIEGVKNHCGELRAKMMQAMAGIDAALIHKRTDEG